ncbi:hypothetical protein ONZ45_g19536 [Pleurotus djamor]|nr:hypothetical protein ONZ45_g19536 [Pleurotus djamor]
MILPTNFSPLPYGPPLLAYDKYALPLASTMYEAEQSTLCIGDLASIIYQDELENENPQVNTALVGVEATIR